MKHCLLAAVALCLICTSSASHVTSFRTSKVTLALTEAVTQYATAEPSSQHQLLQQSNSGSCINVLQNLTNYFLSNNETIEQIFRNSGKDYNDLGRYEDCLNTTGFRYILATVAHALPIPMSVGLCVPLVCTV